MAYCARCGTEIYAEYEFCPECGNMISRSKGNRSANTCDEKYKVCENCGEEMPDDAFYCLRCGNTFDNEDVFDVIKHRAMKMEKHPQKVLSISEGVWKNKWVSLILCIFLGMFGMHRFYEEKRITGFLYLFTFGIFGIGWFFDIILLLTKTNPYRVK